MKTALVFGHTSGFGLAVTQDLLDKKYKVVGFARSVSNIKSDLLENIQVDLSKKEDVAKAIEIVKTKYSRFDCIIYCAGVLTVHKIDNLNYGENENLYKINAFAPMMIESGLLKLIRNNQADVINITSSCLVEYYTEYTEYTTSKAALQRFTQDLQLELKDTSCRVTEFCPGAFASNIYKNMTGEKVNRNEEEQVSAHEYTKVLVSILELPKKIVVPHIYIDRK
jgi:benzil reductase ((S)-benzoin forming)